MGKKSIPKPKKHCKVINCENPSGKKGMCVKHYARYRKGTEVIRWGDLNPGMKRCSKCRDAFPATEEYFYMNKYGKCRPLCKPCHNQQSTDIRKETTKKVKADTTLIGDPNKKKQCVVCKQWFPATTEYFFAAPGQKYNIRTKCKTCFTTETTKRSRLPENRIKTNEAQRKEYANNRKEHSERYKKYYQENIEYHLDRVREYAKNNPEKMREQDNRRREDPQFRLSSGISRSIRQSLAASKNGHHWESLVGYTLKDLVKHIEKQFQPGMSWANYGSWHLDHKIPKSVFNFKSYNDIDFFKCWSLDNLQPLWAKENMQKHDKLDKPFQPSFAFGGLNP